MQLAAFIRANKDKISVEWGRFAATLFPAGKAISALTLGNEIENILETIAADIETSQSAEQQTQKGNSLYLSIIGKDTAAQTHATHRASQGFSLIETTSEYRALRASVIKLWTDELKNPDPRDLMDLTRFNEAIDQAIMESVTRHTEELERSRNMFLGILGHDLRNPLGAISASASLMLSSGLLNPRHIPLGTQIVNSSIRIGQMITDLLDLTRIRLGTGIAVDRLPMDMHQLCQQVVDEMKAFHPSYQISLSAEGDLRGNWDSGRLGQVLSNLIGNAIQHGGPKSPITVAVFPAMKGVTMTVHNRGNPIHLAVIDKIFDKLVQGVSEDTDSNSSVTSLGLGLYIAREIVNAHDGILAVTSTQEAGTTFTAYLPRAQAA